MAQSKKNFAPDISNIACCSYGAYLMVSVPSGDVLNSHTMVLDYAIADEFSQDLAPPAWQGVWTGTRPVEWDTTAIDGSKQVFFASVDYQALESGPYPGSFNHIWQAFTPDRTDSYDLIDDSGAVTTVQNPIYCSFETKQYGDSMDLKKIKFAEIDLVEIGGEVNFHVNYAGSRGGYYNILTKKIIATIDPTGINNVALQQLFTTVAGVPRVQGRRIITSVATVDPTIVSVEDPYDNTVDKTFSLYMQWCGRAGIESFRLYTEPQPERVTGLCEPDETGYNVLTQDGKSFQFT